MTTAKSAHKSTAKKTAAPGEDEATHRARADRVAAEKRTSAKREDGDRATAKGAETATDSQPEALHALHPENAADSAVRHAEPQTGKQAGEGEGGFPAGEYDVVDPAPKPAATAKEEREAALTAHYDGAAGDLDQVVKDALADSRLDASELPKVLEALPVGAVIEHEGPNRWRVHKLGVMRFGHGTTGLQAIENYVLGEATTTTLDAGAAAFLKLSPRQQREIEERDRIAYRNTVGGDPNEFAREEARRTAAADKTAKEPAPNAVSDGPERASARAEAGSKSKGKGKK
jgi:hypothetical protein